MSNTKLPRAIALLVAGTAVVVLAVLLPGTAASAGSSTFAVGIPTVVDPIRGVGEPDIAVDNSGNAWITGPAGTATQTSLFWHTRDGGLTYPLLGPTGGHWLCQASGGGDSLVQLDRVSGQVHLWDQNALADVSSGTTDASGNNLNSGCFTDPAITADRPFATVLHPTGSVKAPQYGAAGSTPVSWMSWLCDGCLGSGNTVGGLAFGWSTDGVNWHAADPGVPADNLVAANFAEAGTINSFRWHGNMEVDPVTGYVFTALSCGGGSCPNGSAGTEFGVAVGKPICSAGADCPEPQTANGGYGGAGQFASLGYQTASNSLQGKPWPEQGSLFPVIAMGRDRTLYEAWIEGDGNQSSGTPPATSWHLYYTYSKDLPDHKVWAPAQRIDLNSGTDGGTSVMGWIAAGDAGRLAAVWLNTSLHEYPSDTTNPDRPWHPYMAVSTNADTASASWQQAQVGLGPNHLGDICLLGTACGLNVPPGNRNMADFISIDIGADGAAQATWADDANRLATLPTTAVPGVPVTETARQVSGPKLIGSGNVSDSRFSTTPTTAGVTDAAGDALYPVYPRSGSGAGTDQPQLDLTGSRIAWDGTNVIVHIPVADLANLGSPDTSCQTNVWWLTTWQAGGKIYFAKAESNGGGTPTFTAGTPGSFDRPGLGSATFPTLVDYSGGTSVTGTKSGNEWVITVPPSLVGGPAKGSVLEKVTAYSVLDDGLPLTIAPGTGAPCEPQDNIPTITDATPAYDAVLGATAGSNPFTAAPAPPAPWLPLGIAAIGAAAVGLAAWLTRRGRSATRAR